MMDPDIFTSNDHNGRWYFTKFRGHCFTPYGEQEALCRACGFVTGASPSNREDLAEMLSEFLGDRTYCGGQHHLFLTKDQFDARMKMIAVDDTRRAKALERLEQRGGHKKFIQEQINKLRGRHEI